MIFMYWFHCSLLLKYRNLSFVGQCLHIILYWLGLLQNQSCHLCLLRVFPIRAYLWCILFEICSIWYRALFETFCFLEACLNQSFEIHCLNQSFLEFLFELMYLNFLYEPNLLTSSFAWFNVYYSTMDG